MYVNNIHGAVFQNSYVGIHMTSPYTCHFFTNQEKVFIFTQPHLLHLYLGVFRCLNKVTGNLLIVEEIVSRKVLIMFSVGLGILYSFCTFAMLFYSDI